MNAKTVDLFIFLLIALVMLVDICLYAEVVCGGL